MCTGGLWEILRKKEKLGRSMRRWEDSVNTFNPHEVGCGSFDWFGLAPDRDRLWALVNDVLNLRVP